MKNLRVWISTEGERRGTGRVVGKIPPPLSPQRWFPAKKQNCEGGEGGVKTSKMCREGGGVRGSQQDSSTTHNWIRKIAKINKFTHRWGCEGIFQHGNELYRFKLPYRACPQSTMEELKEEKTSIDVEFSVTAGRYGKVG